MKPKTLTVIVVILLIISFILICSDPQITPTGTIEQETSYLQDSAEEEKQIQRGQLNEQEIQEVIGNKLSQEELVDEAKGWLWGWGITVCLIALGISVIDLRGKGPKGNIWMMMGIGTGILIVGTGKLIALFH